MEQKLVKPILITTLVFAFISIGNISRLKGIEDVKAIYIISLLTCGIGIGAFLVSLIVFIRSKKKIIFKKVFSMTIDRFHYTKIKGHKAKTMLVKACFKFDGKLSFMFQNETDF